MASIGVRSYDGFYSAPWANATRGVAGTGVKLTADESVDIAGAITSSCLGVLMNDPAQYEMATVKLIETGAIVRAVAGSALTLGDECTVDSAGRFIHYHRHATQTAVVNYGWGVVVKAASHADDLFELQLNKDICRHA